MTALRAPRIALAALPSLLALAVGCGGPAVPPAEPEGASSEPTAAASAATTSAPASDPPAAKPAEEPAPTAAPASDPPAAKPAEEPAPAAQETADVPCEPKAGVVAAKGPKLELTVDRAKVDIEGKRLEVKLSRPACKVVLKVIGESGSVLANVSKPFDGASAGSPLVVGWSPSSAENVSRIEVWGHDTAGFYVGVAITPWNLKIAHEEVNFENDSDAIRASEVPKLEASLQKVKEALTKYKDLGNISLFIAGYTDSVGSAEHNLALSRRRAKSIAGWFRGRGLKIPISHEGLGEYSLLVKTADEVAEPRNRRVDYILSVEPPRLPTGSVTFGWKGL
jgi:outer membrane protein OmpA-like peptidoglycan-associated protein